MADRITSTVFSFFNGSAYTYARSSVSADTDRPARAWLLFFLFFSNWALCGSSWAAPASPDKNTPVILEIADAHIRTIKNWEPGSYSLRIAGSKDGLYWVECFLIQEEEDAKALIKKTPGMVCWDYPSYAILMIDPNKREVVRDIQPGQENRRASPPVP